MFIKIIAAVVFLIGCVCAVAGFVWLLCMFIEWLDKFSWYERVKRPAEKVVNVLEKIVWSIVGLVVISLLIAFSYKTLERWF